MVDTSGVMVEGGIVSPRFAESMAIKDTHMRHGMMTLYIRGCVILCQRCMVRIALDRKIGQRL